MNKLKEKPFALVGVSVNAYDPKKLKEVMVKEEMNWRSTADHGAIAEKWNSPGTPVYYVVDPTGMIRYKWVGSPGAKAIDAGLEKLIEEEEKNGKKGPR